MKKKKEIKEDINFHPFVAKSYALKKEIKESQKR